MNPKKPEKFHRSRLEASYSRIGDSHDRLRALKKIKGSGERVGLLEREEFNDLPRPRKVGPGKGAKNDAETLDILTPLLGEAAEQGTDEQFLRSAQRVAVRRRRGSRFASRFVWKNRWTRLLAGVAVLLLLGSLAAIFLEVKSVLLRNPRFVLASDDQIQVGGNRVVTDRETLAFFAPDLGRSIFRVPLAARQAQLEKIPWVRRAIVMRLWPNTLRVALVERKPVAFVREGNSVRLIDDQGVVLAFPAATSQHYSFPVLSGISAADPPAVRDAKVQTYLQFAQALDAGGGQISATLSEVDLSDPEDVRAMFAANTHRPLVHFGDSHFLARYWAYRAHLAEWLGLYPQLRTVDMRYGRQVVLDTGTVDPANNASAPLQGSSGTGGKPLAATAVNGSAHGAKAKARNKPAAKSRKSSGHPAHRASHRAVVHRHSPKHPSKRGHVVRRPIMHVVKGM